MKNSIFVAQNSHQGVGSTFRQEVEKRTNGRIKIQQLITPPPWAPSASPSRRSQLGTQELTFTSTGQSQLVPAAAILDIPFLFRDKAHARAVLDGPIGPGDAQGN